MGLILRENGEVWSMRVKRLKEKAIYGLGFGLLLMSGSWLKRVGGCAKASRWPK